MAHQEKKETWDQLASLDQEDVMDFEARQDDLEIREEKVNLAYQWLANQDQKEILVYVDQKEIVGWLANAEQMVCQVQ